mmetsp:Transcript_26950/g.68523  ORF Transcript_26950/g.68523 Transcript_26950/m.68523 type:complete len:367 (-) Transcript_26950:237-1337(-)|eukprot:CAMPEP_0195089308 /NCGR_PEP_ID=MMETSP0448-20130528/28626_1 /TAXON_ID=66468 /ORGANISM="Heterocapsa triquestra, Strain CCMP 448" /LENGTH=366 /DNA_ID=CAMNT_0040123031 /DNA_START=90 /DNA_END=1190 /DNA_ORIENTATION=-
MAGKGAGGDASYHGICLDAEVLPPGHAEKGKRRWKALAVTGAAVLALGVIVACMYYRHPRRSGLGAAPEVKQGIIPVGMCPGEVEVYGYGTVSLVNAQWNGHNDPAGFVEVMDGVIPHMKGRTYFGDTCTEGIYSPTNYASLQLLGKRMRYSVDLSEAGCGCNAAFYLTSLSQNTNVSDCSDYYCDASRVCGVSCAEIDIQEANRNAWYSTLHTSSDVKGQGKGYGMDRHYWKEGDYAPQGRCIDTLVPFEVQAEFPVNEWGSLAAMDVTLSQYGKPCNLELHLDKYVLESGEDGMAELSATLARGMTPVISYWGEGASMAWMDGLGDGQGPCATDEPQMCGDKVIFVGFSVEDMGVEERAVETVA